MPKVSVLLPCRNAAAYVPDAIASLDTQTLDDFEVVAVDDGSEDATSDLLRAWARRSSHVHVVRTPPRGLVPALISGLERATGEWIARMDADDVAEPRRLRAQAELLEARPEIAACGTRVRYFPRAALRDGARRYEAWLNSLVEPEAISRDIFVECPIAHPSLVVRRSALEKVGGYRDLGWPEDYDLVLRLWATGAPMAKVPEVLLGWRERPDRLSRVDRRYAPEAFRRLKVSVLRETLLRGRGGLVIWGAGPVGKGFARECLEQRVRLRAFVELDRRKIGQSIYGAPVVAPDGMEGYRDAFAVAAVGSHGARDEIRAELTARGWREMQDFCAVA